MSATTPEPVHTEITEQTIEVDPPAGADDPDEGTTAADDPDAGANPGHVEDDQTDPDSLAGEEVDDSDLDERDGGCSA